MVRSAIYMAENIGIIARTMSNSDLTTIVPTTAGYISFSGLAIPSTLIIGNQAFD
jgi:hypothetical protein